MSKQASSLLRLAPMIALVRGQDPILSAEIKYVHLSKDWVFGHLPAIAD